MSYNEHKDRGTFERQWLATLMKDGIQQGIFVASSGGHYLGRANRGWPDPDPKETLQALRQSLADYRRLGAQRRLSKSLDAARDRLKWEQDAFTKPAGTLDLRISSRGYPFSGMTSADQRHPMYYHVDRLWFKPSEWRKWLPPRLAVGARTTVTGPALTRIVMLSHTQAGSSAWWEEHIRNARMVSEVTGVQGDDVTLRISATYDMRADSQWNLDTYRGDLLAFATYDRKANRFARFELATLGTHTVGRMMSNLHVGNPTQRVAAYATINPAAAADDRMIPQNWKYGYSLAWCRSE
ncbi:MAG: hypothetical protein ACO1SV_18980 [Fimbriimonas sp.]